MMAINEVKKIDYNLENFLKSLSIKELRDTFKKILNYEYVPGLSGSSKELYALALEKRIVTSIENQTKKMKKPSFWKQYKLSAPIVDKSYLENYIDLAIRDLYTKKNKNETLDEINKYYNSVIYHNSKLFRNRMVNLPNGKSVSISDISIAISKTMEPKDIVRLNYTIKEKVDKVKVPAKLAFLITIGAISLNYVNDKNIDDNNVKIESTYENKEIKNTTPVVEINNIKESETIIEQTNEPIFIGYEGDCPIDYQQYALEMCHKYNVPFNLLMSIVHTESNGSFNTNKVISDSDDYGLCQINICNHEYIYKNLGYSSSELLNEPKKNIEASVYLIKSICDLYPDSIKSGDYTEIFGTYNGWKNWRQKPISISYVEKTNNALNTIYNKEEFELYNNLEENKTHAR